MLTLVDNSVPLFDDMRARGFSDFGSCQLFGLAFVNSNAVTFGVANDLCTFIHEQRKINNNKDNTLK